jgi:hypothetical protein
MQGIRQRSYFPCRRHEQANHLSEGTPVSAEPPEFTHWKDAWEWHASQTAASYDEMSGPHLLDLIRGRNYDSYYTIWYRLDGKTTLAEAAPVLLEVLRRESAENMDLVRYHCAAALFSLMGYDTEQISPLRARVQWAHAGEPARQEAIDELELEISERLTPS